MEHGALFVMCVECVRTEHTVRLGIQGCEREMQRRAQCGARAGHSGLQMVGARACVTWGAARRLEAFGAADGERERRVSLEECISLAPHPYLNYHVKK